MPRVPDPRRRTEPCHDRLSAARQHRARNLALRSSRSRTLPAPGPPWQALRRAQAGVSLAPTFLGQVHDTGREAAPDLIERELRVKTAGEHAFVDRRTAGTPGAVVVPARRTLQCQAQAVLAKLRVGRLRQACRRGCASPRFVSAGCCHFLNTHDRAKIASISNSKRAVPLQIGVGGLQPLLVLIDLGAEGLAAEGGVVVSSLLFRISCGADPQDRLAQHIRIGIDAEPGCLA